MANVDHRLHYTDRQDAERAAMHLCNDGAVWSIAPDAANGGFNITRYATESEQDTDALRKLHPWNHGRRRVPRAEKE